VQLARFITPPQNKAAIGRGDARNFNGVGLEVVGRRRRSCKATFRPKFIGFTVVAI